jgi:amyloid beta precursor protein binding protein 1
MNFYILFHVVDQLPANYTDDLAYSIGTWEMCLKGALLSEDLITEVCRFADAEIHSVTTFIDGMAS